MWGDRIEREETVSSCSVRWGKKQDPSFSNLEKGQASVGIMLHLLAFGGNERDDCMEGEKRKEGSQQSSRKVSHSVPRASGVQQSGDQVPPASRAPYCALPSLTPNLNNPD